MVKNQPLIKQYQNSFFLANLAEDLLRIENCTFKNISIEFDNNAMIVIADRFQLYDTYIEETFNYDKYGALYILSDDIDISNSHFLNNNAPKGDGGALFIDADTV